MSADRDDNHSESLDVAEQKSSNLIPPGDGGGIGVLTENIATSTIPNNSPTSRARGDAGRPGGRMGSRPKTRKGTDSTSQAHKTLMRTHSAPPDEHAGINFGGIGTRTMKTNPYSQTPQPNQLQGSFPANRGPPTSDESSQSKDSVNTVPVKDESGAGSEERGDVRRTATATSRDAQPQRGNQQHPHHNHQQQQQRQPYASPVMRGGAGYPRPPHPHVPGHAHGQSSGAPEQGVNKHKAAPPVSSNIMPRTANPSMQCIMMPPPQYPHQSQHFPHMHQPVLIPQGRPQMMPHMMQQPPGHYVSTQHPGQPGMMFYPTQQQGIQPQVGYHHPNGMMQMHGGGMGHVMNRGGMQSHDDVVGAAARAPPVYMSGDVRQQQLQSVPLPPAPPVQSFSVQQQQQQAQGQSMQSQHMQQQNFGQMQQFAPQQMQTGTPVAQPLGQGHPQSGRGNADIKKRQLVLKDKHGNVISLGELKGPVDASASGSTSSSVTSSPHLAAVKTSPATAAATAALPLHAPILPPTAISANDVPPAVTGTDVTKSASPVSPPSPASSSGEVAVLSAQVNEMSVSDSSPKTITPVPATPAVSAVQHDIHSISGSLVITPPDEIDDDNDQDKNVSAGISSAKPLLPAAENPAPTPQHERLPDALIVNDSSPPPPPSQTAASQSLPPATMAQTAAVPQTKPVVPATHVVPVGTLIVESPDDDDQANSEQSHSSAPLQCGGSSIDKKSKKNLRKEKIAAADLTRDVGSDMLDAYTSIPQKEAAPVAATEKTQAGRVAPIEAKANLPKPDADTEDDWETQALKIADAAEAKPEPVVRSLRPGGGSAAARIGTNAKRGPKVASYVYRKAELLRLRVPLDQLQRPAKFFENIFVIGPNNQPLPRGTYGTKSPQQLQQQYYGVQQMDPRYSRGAPPVIPQHHLNPPPGMSAMGLVHVDEGKPNWKRGHQSRKGRQPVPPMPRKVVTDPVEAMSREVTAILNRITPQTFLKLTHKLAEIETSNSTMLERLIQLVVDKAISEPTFARLYAEMVSILDSENKYMTFCHVVWNKDSNQFFWIRDLQFSSTLVGPFQSPGECVDASQAQILPMAVPVSHPLLKELVVVNGILVNVFKNGDRDEYFFKAMPLTEVDSNAMSDACFSTREAAWKSATKKHAFVKMLVKICQAEYLASTENTGFYAIPGERRDRLNRERGQMSEDEIAQEVVEIEELEGGAKRRMMGNVRFIGELCKKGIIKTNIMHDCIRDLLFRPVIDEQMLELVCKLLRTVGQLLEETASADQKMRFDSYFSKLAELASNKRVNSRVRFSMDEIISLRRNNWQERRETDGPALLEEIRMKAAKEEQIKRMQQQQQQQGGGRGRGGRGGGGRMGVHQQQQYYEPRTPPLTRNSSVGPGSTSSGNRGTVAPVNFGGTEIKRFSSDPTASAILRDSQVDSRQYDSPGSTGSITPPRADAAAIDPDLASRKARNIIDEYLQLRDDKEAFECLAELPDFVCGDFVVSYIDKFLYCNKDDVKGDLSNLLEVVMPQLQSAQVHVETSLAKCEAILHLVDVVVDVKTAPEMLGSIIKSLLRGSACRLQVIDQILSDVRKANSEDEYGYPDEEVAGICGRFRSAFS